MVYTRALEEAYTMARGVELSCGRVAELEEALRVIEELMERGGGAEELEYAGALLRQAGDVLRLKGCLDWHLLVQAADIVEHA